MAHGVGGEKTVHGALCGVNHSFRPTLTRAAVGRRATALPSSFANDRHLSGSTLKLHRRPSVGHVAVPSVCGPPGALSLMPEAVVCRRDDAAFFFRKARRDPMRMHPVRRLAVISRAAFRPFAG